MALAMVFAFAALSELRAQESGSGEIRSASPVDITAGYRLAPKAFRLAAERVTPSIVSIETFGGLAPSGAARPGTTGGLRRPGDGPTTGLIVSSDGFIATSTFNFIEQPPVIVVTLRDGRRQVARMLGRDDGRKICLLKIDDVADLPVPEFAPRSELRVGQWAISVGVGYGDANPAISAGMISATSRISGRAVQTDANLSPANYGGPLVDIEGRVIGVCTPLSPEGTGAASGVEWYDSGIGFAVPLHGADALLAALKAGQNVLPGFLGVQMAASSAASPAEEGGAELLGVPIEKVLDDSPAARAGLAAHDRILGVDGEKVIDAAGLRIALGKRIAGEKVRIEFARHDITQIVEATLAAPPANQQPAKAPPPTSPPAPDAPKPDAPKPAP
jgi:serine protease Do